VNIIIKKYGTKFLLGRDIPLSPTLVMDLHLYLQNLFVLGNFYPLLHL